MSPTPPPPPPRQDNQRLQEQPRKRRRVALACDRCRDRKIKCDGVRPACWSCRQRQQRQHPQDSNPCTYHGDVLKFANEREYIDVLQSRIRRLEQASGDQRITGYLASLEKSAGSDGGTESDRLGQNGRLCEPVPSSSFEAVVEGRIKARSVPLEESAASIDSMLSPIYSISGFQGRTVNILGPHGNSHLTNSAYSNDAFIVGNGTESSAPSKGRSHRASFDMGSPETDANTHQHQDNHSKSDIEGSMTDSEGTVSAMGAAATIDADSLASQTGYYGASSAIAFFSRIQVGVGGSTPSDSLLYKMRNQKSSYSTLTLGRSLDIDTNIKLQDMYLPPRKLTDYLLDSYWDRVHCLYPIIHKSSFQAVYTQLWVSEESTERTRSAFQIGLGSSACPMSVFYCGLNAMLALGCNLSDMPDDQRRTLSDSFCQRSLDLALGNLLDNNSLALVQALFILGQYLQSTDHPTRCWNVVGLALRVAQGIGLYMDKSSSDDAILETEIKRRTWHGCLLLDTITSITLGRPALASRDANVPLPAAVDDIYLESGTDTGIQPAEIFSLNMFFVQALKLYAIFGEVLTHVYKPWQNRTEDGQQVDGWPTDNLIKTIVDLEHDLLRFKANLPLPLSWDQIDKEPCESWILERQRNILYTRFLHLKVLLYRPLFHWFHIHPQRSLLPRIAHSEGTYPDSTVMGLVAQRCSNVCIESAQALIDFVHRSSETKAAGAWWYNIFYMFTSAMILILAGSNQSTENMVPEHNIEESWQKCLGTLDRLASKHVRARKCAKILVKLRAQAFAARTATSNGASSKDPPAARTAANPTLASAGQQVHVTGAAGYGGAPIHGPFYEDAVEFHDPLLQDVLGQESNGQFLWDSFEDGWWPDMLERS